MMESPDIQVPDTIPVHITRRHQRRARRTVARAGRSFSVLGLNPAALRALIWGTLIVTTIGLTTGVVMLWIAFPSPLSFVGVPSVLLLVAFGAGLFAYRNRHTLP